MIGGLKPYAIYKDSGVAWLGDVPELWEVRRLRDSVEGCINGIWGDDPNGREDLPCIRVADFDRERLRVRLSKPTMRAIAPNERRRRMLTSGDLLLEKSGGGEQQPVGVVMLYDHNVPAVCSNFVARMPVSPGFSPGYLNYLHSHLYAIRLNVRSIKQTTGIQNLDSSAYLSETVAFPPFVEQSAAVRFLDHADRRLRRYMIAKQKLIRLIEEQKRVIVYRSVTHGLDPNVRLKPSGVEWLVDVPEHWDLVPNRSLLKLRKRLVGGASGDYKLLSLTKRGVIPRNLDNPQGKFPASFDTYQVVQPGDLVFCLFDIDETPRAVGLSSVAGMVTGAYTRFECVDADTREYIYRFYLAMDDGKRLKPLYTGLRKVITKSAFLSAKMPLPPRSERVAIVEHIDEQFLHLDRIRDRAERDIALLREYRTSLIADVVTGRIDVREAAKGLPALPDESMEAEEESLLGDLEPTEQELETEPVTNDYAD
jgi:type I restriction enzyme S subunit